MKQDLKRQTLIKDLNQRFQKLPNRYLLCLQIDLEGYESFGWWDRQGDRENTDQVEAAELDLDLDSDEAEDFAECLSRYE